MPPPHFEQFIDPCNDPNFNKPPPVTGVSQTLDNGVFGVHCAGGTGVKGHSATGTGARGDSDSGNGVEGRSTSGNGVQGTSSSGVGVRGSSRSGVAVRGDSESFLGVFGRSNTNDGIQGRSAAHDHAGVSAINETNGFGLFASSDGGGLAGVFNGGIKVTGNIEVTGDVILPSGLDVAEDFEIQSANNVEPGLVMVLDSNAKLHPCQEPYDKKVAGVIAGAGEFKPGIVLGKAPSMQSSLPIALLGKTYCRVDAGYGRIRIGDLLTTSATIGHAMRADDPIKAFGAVIGKALRSVVSGKALIPILIALQ
jgi:hypothetical protein